MEITGIDPSRTQSGKTQIPDYEQIFCDETNEKRRSTSGIYKRLIAKYRGGIFLSSILYVIKHSPVWLIPLVTGEVINTVTSGVDVAKRLSVYAVILFLLLAQNIPMHILYSRHGGCSSCQY